MMKIDDNDSESVFATENAMQVLRIAGRRVGRRRSRASRAKMPTSHRTPRANRGSTQRVSTSQGFEVAGVVPIENAPQEFEGSCIAMAEDLLKDGLLDWLSGQQLRVVVMGSLDEQSLIDRIRRLPSRVRLLHLDADDVKGLISRALNGKVAPTYIVRVHRDASSLHVLNAGLQELVVPTARLLEVKHLRERDLGRFEIDVGALWFPGPDVHLDWEALRRLVDPAEALRAKQVSDEFNARYGAAIRALREATGLRQSDIDGVTERHLSRVETGVQRATLKVLDRLAAAHGKDLQSYLDAIAVQMGQPAG